MQLYEQVPAVEGCTNCGDCCGHVPIKREEIAAIGFDAQTWDWDCRYRTDKCECYENRPLLCRMFAAWDEMKCPHGAVADKPLTKHEGIEMIHKYDELFSDSGMVT